MTSPVADRPGAPGRPGSTGTQQTAAVEIRLIGSFTVRRQGIELAASELGSRKARQLLKLVTVRRGHLVPVDEIVDVLWAGDQPPSQARENVATLVSRLRGLLGAQVVVGGRGGYDLGPAGHVQVDLDIALRWLVEAETRVAEGEPGLGMASAHRAIELLAAGSVLDDEPAAEWAEPARQQLATVQRGARIALARAALEAGDARAALPVAVAAHEADRFDETACRLLMRAYAGLGEPARAVAAYADLRDLLATELGADPAAETQALHLSLLRDEAVPSARPVVARGAESAGLVGRTVEMQALRTGWNAAAAGAGSLVLISGEAGIGKTRLSDELASVADWTGGTLLRTRCYETERSLFLQPAVDAIATAFRTLPPDRTKDAAGEWAGVLANLVPSAIPILGPAAPHGRGTVAVERRRAFEAVTAFVRRLSAHSPVLLVIDDLHVAGRASVELLHYLTRHTTTNRIMTIGTVRSDEGADALQALADVATRLELGVLSADAVSRLAAAAGQAELAESVQQRTGGHALFVVESLRSLAAGEAGLPRSLQDAVVSRVARTGPGVEELLRAGSVLGASFQPAIVARLLGESLPVVLSRGEEALAARLLVASGRDYEFANDLIREVLYATTPAPSRLAHHALAADLLTDRPEAVAVHAAAGEDWLRAARALLLAGEQALDRFAADDAEELLGRCLEMSDRASDVEMRARGRLARASARTARAAYGAAVEDLDEAVRLARLVGDRRLEMLALRARGGEAPTLMGVGLAETTGHLHGGLKIATALGDRATEADLLGWLAVLSCNALRFDEGVDYGRRAVAAARVSGSDEALAAALDGRKTSLAYLGEIDQLVPVLAELEPLAYRLDHPQRLHWMIFESGFPALAAGDWATARSWFERALEACRRSGYVGYEAWHVAHLGWLARLQGDAATALELGRRAVELNRETPNAWCGAAASALLGTTLLELGDVASAVAVLEAGCELATPEGSQSYLLRCLAPLAEADGERTTLERADALLASVATPYGGAWMGGDFAYLSVARAWLAAGNPQRAREVLAPMLAVARRVPWVAPLAYGSLLDGRAAARLDEPGLARVRFEEATQVAAQYGLVQLAAEAQAELV